MRTTSVAAMLIFFGSVIPKVLHHSYVQSSFSTITRHLKSLTTAFEIHLEDTIEDFTDN